VAFRIRKIERMTSGNGTNFSTDTPFCEREPSEAITRRPRTNLRDAASSFHAIVAVSDSGDVLGIACYVVHEIASALALACYSQDSFVDPVARASDVPKPMFDWLAAGMSTPGWSRIRRPDFQYHRC
jgi:hypothetical protein